jgi:hypothetical protein
LTAGYELGKHRDLARRRVAASGFDQTHAATGDDSQPRMPAVMRHIGPRARGDLNAIQAFARGEVDRLSVYEDRGHDDSDFRFQISDLFNQKSKITNLKS